MRTALSSPRLVIRPIDFSTMGRRERRSTRPVSMAIPLVILVLIVVSLHWNNTFADWTMLTLCWHFLSPMSSRSTRQNQSSRGEFRMKFSQERIPFGWIWNESPGNLISFTFILNPKTHATIALSAEFQTELFHLNICFDLRTVRCHHLERKKHILINNSHQMLKTVTYGSIDGWVEKCHSQWPEILFHKDCATKSTENLKWKNKTGHKYAMFCNDWTWIRSTRQKCRPINALLKFSNHYHL